MEEARARSDLSYRSRLETGVTFGSFDGDALVGMLSYLPETGAHTGHRGWIYSVYLQPAYRGSGRGDGLIAAALAQGRADGLAQLELHVSSAAPRARAFYARHGFAPAGSTPRALRVDGVFHDELHMIRRLDA